MGRAGRFALITIMVVAGIVLTVVMLRLQYRETRLHGPGTGNAGWLFAAAVGDVILIVLCAQVAASGIRSRRRRRRMLTTWRIIAIAVGVAFLAISLFVLTALQSSVCVDRNLGTYVAPNGQVYNVWPNGAHTLRTEPANPQKNNPISWDCTDRGNP